MELYESRFKKFLNVAKVMKMVGENKEVSGEEAMKIAKDFYNTLMSVEDNETKVLAYIKNISNNADLVKGYSVEDHIEAYRVSESKLDEGIVSNAMLSVLASVIMSGGLSNLDDNKFNPDDFDHGDDVEMVDFDDDGDDEERKSGIDPHRKGVDPHSIDEAKGGDEMDTSGSITFKQAKKLGFLPIDSQNSSTKLRERNLRYFTITKPNDAGFSKVIYWIEKEVADAAGEDFRVDDSIDVSLYS